MPNNSQNLDKKDSTQQTEQPKVAVDNPKPTDPLIAKFTNPKTGEKWYAQPKELSNLGYINSSDTKYYEIGTHNEDKIILSYGSNVDGPGQIELLYQKSPDGTVTAILNYDAAYNKDNGSFIKSALGKSVKVDTSIFYDSLNIQNTDFLINKNGSATGATFPIFVLDNPSTQGKNTIIKNYGNGFKLIRQDQDSVQTNTTQIYYFLETPIGIQYTLKYIPLAQRDGTQYTWVDGSHPTKQQADTLQYLPMVGGCGMSKYGAIWDKTGTDADFVKVASTSTGQTLYTFKDISNPVLQKYYDLSKDESVQTSSGQISLQQFYDSHSIIIYKNNVSQWLLYFNEEHFDVGGCGKPVIYLYPTKAENVTVKVGADVKKSEPKYNPTTGWKVLAQPNGQLTINNKRYNSLFWEGLGNGFYPTITNGTIVKKVDTVKTMRKQLKQQGLKANEINDFMDYWQPKIPNKPFVRLTWFNTEEMNQLAPLSISPKPQTLVRVFLDMKGLNKKSNIPVQKLTSVPRKGFTAVEWGGLLRGGIK